jgi:SAM-dependent methyltransferase
MTDRSTNTQPVLPPLSIRAWLRYDTIRKILDELEPKTVLEIGCGQGALGARLATRASYTGLEPDASSFGVAKVRIESCGGSVINGTDQAVPVGDTFDLVCAFEVLEHIEDDQGALESWRRLVGSGGNLLLSVPAWQDRFGPMDENVGHFRRYNPRDLSAKLTAAGFSDPHVTVYGWPLGFALEAVRNRIDDKKLAKAKANGASASELTAASGRTFQPQNRWVGRGVQIATTPFRIAQRAKPRSGIGLVAVAKVNV